MSVATASSPNYDVPRPSAESTLRLESWYHGTLTRIRAESLVRAEGDFLVRDSISSQGDFVLTVFWKGRAIHFQINRISSSESSTGFYFQFEDEQFESVSDLISFYQSHRRAVTLSSGCIISNPVPKSIATNSSEPYKEIEQNYMKMFFPQASRNGIDRCLSQQVLLNQACKFLNRASSSSNVASTTSSPPSSPKQHLALSALLNRPLPIPERSPVQEDQSEYCEMDYDTMEPAKIPTMASDTDVDGDILDASTSSLSRCAQHSSLTSLNSLKNIQFSNNAISQSCQDVSNNNNININNNNNNKRSNTKLHWRLPRTDSAPSLPARKPSAPVRDSGFVADSADYDQPRPSNSTDPTTLIDAVHYRSALIDAENRPQTKELVDRFRNLLLKNSPEHCALLITMEDCRLLRFNKPKSIVNGLRQFNGMALLLLPQGSAMRADLIERSRSLQFLCTLSILNGNRMERCAVMSAWIQVAYALLKQFGNLFAYVTVMSALRSKVLSSVPTLCADLSPEISAKFHTELIPWFQQITGQHESIADEQLQMTIPCIQPLLDLLSSTPSSTFLNMSSLSAQIESLWRWLQCGREWALNADRLQQAASQRCVTESASQLLSSTTEGTATDNFFSTEFALRFLFGARGCCVDAQLRYQKLAALVQGLVEKAQLETD